MESFEPLVEALVEVADLSFNAPERSRKEKEKKQPSKEKKRLRHSNWLFLVNTNKQFPNREDDMEMWETAAKLKKRLQEFTTSTMLGSMITFKSTDHSWSTEYIKGVDPIKPVVKIGDKKNCLHAHFRLSIHHYSCINLNYGKVKSFFKDELPGCVVLMQTYRNDLSIDDYVAKNLAPLKLSCEITDNSGTNVAARSNERSEDSSLAQ
jgi:hypothetical protein